MVDVNVISSWDRPCGIADTTKILTDHLNHFTNINLKICPISNPESKNPLDFIKIIKKIKNNQITHIQYQPALFGSIPFPYASEHNYYSLIVFLLKHWKKNKIITTVHEIGLNFPRYKIIIRNLDKSDRIIVHNQRMASILEKEGINGNKIVNIPLGTFSNEVLNPIKCKEKLGFNNKTLITIFGFLSPNKGHELVMDVIPDLNPDILLLIAGGAMTEDQKHYETFLKEKVELLGLEERVIFLDFVEDNQLPALCSATDLFIYPYKWIVASAAINMALSYKKPTLTSDIGYFKDIKNDFQCIELFEKENKEDLREKIVDILDNSQKQKFLKERCEEFNVKTSWGSVSERTKRLYEGLSDLS